MLLSLDDLEAQTAWLGSSLTSLGALADDLLHLSDRAITEQAKRLLIPYVQELERHLRALIQRGETLAIDREGDEPLIQRFLRLALYCELLIRNLVLALQGTELPVEQVDLNDQIRQVLNLLEHKLSDVTISFDLTQQLPFVLIAAVEVKQLLMNVIKNAVEAMGMQGELSISTIATSDYVKVRIKDNGVGIAPQNRTNIFKLNFSTKMRSNKNSGVGLYAVKSIVRRAGGSLGVASASEGADGKLRSWTSGFGRSYAPRWTHSGTLFEINLPSQKEVLNAIITTHSSR